MTQAEGAAIPANRPPGWKDGAYRAIAEAALGPGNKSFAPGLFAATFAEAIAMKAFLVFATAGAALLAASAAEAKGCIKGAIVGGVAGHYAGHHGVLGAAAGCAIGRHRANERDREPAHQDGTR
jgi:hypothetical protein